MVNGEMEEIRKETVVFCPYFSGQLPEWTDEFRGNSGTDIVLLWVRTGRFLNLPFYSAYELNVSDLQLMLIFTTLRADWSAQARNGMAMRKFVYIIHNIFFTLNFTGLDERQNESEIGKFTCCGVRETKI
jgi:hypothetical protein